ncbi:MAG: hypothetical protein U5K37_10530 [Natrialbaceae archaeon]|nr:hypothetical protein [Natrialbaceae archaeon]
MEIDTALEECSLVDRVVLLGVIAAAETGETPVRMDAVRSICNESFTGIDDRSTGGV